MNFSWVESLLMGLVSGITDILPVSAQAHRIILLKLFGKYNEPVLLRLFIHIGMVAALYFANSAVFVRMFRARNLSRIPKKKRKRPLDVRSLMDLSLCKTMLVPVIVAYFFFEKVSGLAGNKDSRTLSRVEGILMGLGGAISVIPGFSGVGASVSVASVSGVDRKYALNMSLIMNMGIMIALVVYDFKALFTNGAGALSFGIVLIYLLSGAIAFGAAVLTIRFMRNLAENSGYAVFSYYCWGVALFMFALNLMA